MSLYGFLMGLVAPPSPSYYARPLRAWHNKSNLQLQVDSWLSRWQPGRLAACLAVGYLIDYLAGYMLTTAANL